MANYVADPIGPHKSDNRIFASYPLPAKIDLLNEKPRHEIAVEQQLGTKINMNSNAEPLSRPSSAELARKEAKLNEEIANLQRKQYSSYDVPSKIDLSSERLSPRHSSVSPRPRSTDLQEDLIQREIKLLEEIAELEQKPYNPQKILLQHEKWYEYPPGHPEYRQVIESKHHVKDFSMPSNSYPDSTITAERHNYNLQREPPASFIARTSPVSSVHTAVIKVPNREVDNRSPLPFSFDNFSTKGVRGNIATVGAVPPEHPYPPICHSIRRTRSPIAPREDRR